MSSYKFKSLIYTDDVDDLCEFYIAFIKEHFVLSKDVVSDVRKILQSKRDLPEVLKNPLSYLLSYLLKYGAHDDSLSFLNFYDTALECPKIVQKLCCKNRIKICCFGNESLPACLGVCKAIDEFALHYSFSDTPLEVHLFLIDRNSGWKRQCQNLVSAVSTDCKNVELKLKYIVADMAENWENDDLLAVSNSHIVVLSRYLSKSSFTKVDKFLQKTVDKMKKSAFLFYLDDLDHEHHDTLKDVISQEKSFSKLRTCRLKYMSLESMLIQKYGCDFPFLWTHKLSPVTCSIWVKYPGVIVKPTSNSDELMFPAVISPSDMKNITVQPFIPKVPSVLSKPKVGCKSTKSAIRNKNDRHRQKAKKIAASRYGVKSDDEDED